MQVFLCLNFTNCDDFEEYLNPFLEIVDVEHGNAEVLTLWRRRVNELSIFRKMVHDILAIQPSSGTDFSATRF